jgi:hypothetical protein
MIQCLGRFNAALAVLAMSCCSMGLAQTQRYPQTQTPLPSQRPYQPAQAAAQQLPPQYPTAPTQTYPQQSFSQQPYPGQQQPPFAQQQPGQQQFAQQPYPQSANPPAQQPQTQYPPAQYPQAQYRQPQPGQTLSNYPATQGGYPSTPAAQSSDHRVAQQPHAPAAPGSQVPQAPSVAMRTSGAAEHPILPTLRWAHQAKGRLEAMTDYSCTFVKRELIDGEMGEHQYLFLKVRHQPFSVYIYFMGPADVKGQEAIYVAGRNDGNILAHSTGLKDTLVGTLSLKPDSAMAMKGNRHPITQIGLLNLTKKTIANSERATQYSDCDVKYFPGAKINGRTCTCTQITLAQRRPETPYKMTRIFVDDELGLPIRYETYGWTNDAKGQPQLEEEYTYLNLKFNNNFADADFDHKNPAYKFR